MNNRHHAFESQHGGNTDEDRAPRERKPRGFDNEHLDKAFRRAIAWFDSLSPEEQAAHCEAQRQSWVRGEMALDRAERKEVMMPDDTRKANWPDERDETNCAIAHDDECAAMIQRTADWSRGVPATADPVPAMPDIERALREGQCANGCNSLKTCLCAVADEAADTIASLRARVSDLERQRDELREALKPFAGSR